MSAGLTVPPLCPCTSSKVHQLPGRSEISGCSIDYREGLPMTRAQARRKTGFPPEAQGLDFCVGVNSRSWFISAPELPLVCTLGACVAAER